MNLSTQATSGKGIILGAFLALLMIGCDKNSDSEQEAASVEVTTSKSLSGTNWQVEDVASGGVIDSANLTLIFGDDGRLNGSSGCNSYMGEFSESKNKLEVGKVAGTRMACAPALMDLEQKFLSVLSGAATYSIDAERSKLTITAVDGQTITASLIPQA